MAPDPRSRLPSAAAAGATATITAAAAASLVPSSDDGTESAADADAAALDLLRRQLALLLLLRCLRTAHLAQPIIVPYYSSSPASGGGGGIGLSPASVLWLGSFYSALVTIVEMPSGFLSDFYGRRTTLHLAFLGLGSSLLVSFAAASPALGRQGMWAALAASQLLRALGSALFSGTDMALLYELLRRYHRSAKAAADERVLDVESRHVFFTTATEAAFAAVGGVAGEAWGLRATVAASAVPFLAGAGVCLLLEDDSPGRAPVEGAETVAGGGGGGDRGGNGKKKKNGVPSSGGGRKDDAVVASRSMPAREEQEPEQTVVARKSSNLILPGVAAAVRSPSVGGGASSASAVTPQSGAASAAGEGAQPSPFSLLLHVPPRLRTIFLVGVALNCGTYVASTALGPLLWSAAGIPTLHFGWIGAANGGASAVAALLAPALRRMVSRMGRGEGGGGGTEGLLLLLLAASAVAYGMMASSARLSSASVSVSASASRHHPAHAVAMAVAVGASVLLSMVRGLAWPVLGAAINASISDNGSRATTLSAFAAAVKVGMVGTGFVLGLILGEKAPNGDRDGNLGASVPGLFEACTLCGLTLASIGIWFGVAGLAPHRKEEEEEPVDKRKRA